MCGSKSAKRGREIINRGSRIARSDGMFASLRVESTRCTNGCHAMMSEGSADELVEPVRRTVEEGVE